MKYQFENEISNYHTLKIQKTAGHPAVFYTCDAFYDPQSS
jgi:hypothetical protein